MPEPEPEAVELTGAGLRLRPYRSTDASALLPAVRESIEPVGRWLPWCHAGYDAGDADAWIRHCAKSWRSGDEFAFAVFDAGSDDFLGGAGLNQRNRTHNFMNLGYWVRASRQKQGIASRAARLVAAFGFESLGLTRIEILAEAENRASRRVAESIGARLETIARNRLVAPGRVLDAALYSLVAPSAHPG